MLSFHFHQNQTINEEFDFWGGKGVVLGGLGVANIGTTWEHVSAKINRCTLFVRGGVTFCTKSSGLLSNIGGE